MAIFKKIGKFAGIFILAVLVWYLGAEVGFQVRYHLHLWENDRAMEKFNKAIEEMFSEDIDGGETPEQTFNLFVDALKNNDVDLAVKYFVLDVERRQKYYDEFNALKQEGKLEAYVEGLPKWEEFEQVKDDYNNWENRAMVEHASYYSNFEIVNLPDGAGGYIETELPPGNYVDYSVIFIKNQNNIWKIESF